MGSFSLLHWLVVLVIVLLVFGTKRLANGAKDIGSAIKEFKKPTRRRQTDRSAWQHFPEHRFRPQQDHGKH